MKEKIKSICSVVDNKFYFKLLYLFVSLTFVTILKCIPKINILSKITLIWGLILLVIMIFNGYKTRKIYKFDIPLACFIGITFLFNIFIYRSGENIKDWIINLILLCVIFSVDVFRNKKELIRELRAITYFYSIFMFIASIASLIMKISDITLELGEVVFSGNIGGVFENKNVISIAASLAIVMCIYLNYINKKFKVKVFIFSNIVVQLLTMISFDGRSSFLVVMAVIYMFMIVYNPKKPIRVLLLLIPILLAVSGIAFEGDRIRDFTSGRTSLWESAEIVIKDNPVTGVGNYNLIESVRNARETDDLPGLQYGGLHNSYIQIAAVNGLIALSMIVIFFVSILTFIVRRLDNLRRSEKLQMTTLTSLIVGVLAVNMFESTLLYIISFISLIFWIYLGYIISILDNKNIN